MTEPAGPAALDLPAYLERVRWQGPLAADLATLRALQRAHMRHIPFENLDVLLGRTVRLDLHSVQAKLVQGSRGGYCFEHATLLAAVLTQIGFDVAAHTARVTLFAPASASPRGHMVLSVRLPDGRYVVDPGFGSLGAEAPVPIVDAGADGGGVGTHWLTSDGRHWILKVRTAGAVVDGWATSLETEHPIDFEVGNHYMSTHPDSPMARRLMMSIRRPGGQATVMNQDFTVREDERTTTRTIADRAALDHVMKAHFGIVLPQREPLRVPGIADGP